MDFNLKTPFLGSAYYPEDWPDEELPKDIARMKEAGLTVARIGEFAWRKMEPERGKYDFKWLHRVVDSLGEAGIAVVMGTPTATPPIWLGREHPDVFKVDDRGIKQSHGGRRHCCSNNPEYQKASREIVEAMGKEFGADPYIVGWQIDNEISSFGIGCTCDCCLRKFHEHLKTVYGSADEINRRWNLNLFSQGYDSIDEIPAPINAWHNPHIALEWALSHHDSDIEFINMQADILRKYTTAPIGTDMMPFGELSHEKMNEKLDVVMFNHYNVPENINEEVFWMDRMRAVKDRPFWNTETQTNWNGAAYVAQPVKPEGFCRVNSWLPVALGGEGNMYWLFRQHWAGHELMHGYVYSPEGRPSHVQCEIQQTSKEFSKASEYLNNSKLRPQAAIHYLARVSNMFNAQTFYWGNNYFANVMQLHNSLHRLGVQADVIDSGHDLTQYKAVFSPLVMTLEENGLDGKIKEYVKNGGTWIAGPMTDVRNSIGAHYIDRAMGIIEEMLGVRQDYHMVPQGENISASWSDGSKLGIRNWAELYTLPEKSESLAKVTSGHSALLGENIIGIFRYGKGTVVLCGALLDDASLDRLTEKVLALSGVSRANVTGSVVAAPRYDASGKLVCTVICETAAKPAAYTPISGEVTDILTGNKYTGTIELKPYDVMVLV